MTTPAPLLRLALLCLVLTHAAHGQPQGGPVAGVEDGTAPDELVTEGRNPDWPPIPKNAPKQFPGMNTDNHWYGDEKGRAKPSRMVCANPNAQPCGNKCITVERECDTPHGTASWPYDVCEKICMTGKPCGDDCVDIDSDCHVIHGNACPPFGDPWPYQVAQEYKGVMPGGGKIKDEL